MIAENTVSKILDISNIVDVISEFVSLRKRGINLNVLVVAKQEM